MIITMIIIHSTTCFAAEMQEVLVIIDVPFRGHRPRQHSVWEAFRWEVTMDNGVRSTVADFSTIEAIATNQHTLHAWYLITTFAFCPFCRLTNLNLFCILNK